MEKLIIVYPIVTFKQIEVEVTKEQASDLCDHYIDRDKFIESQIEIHYPDDLKWLPFPVHEAIDDDFATFKRKPKGL